MSNSTLDDCTSLYKEFIEAIHWQDTQAVANICKNLNAKAVSKTYSDQQEFLNHNWELDDNSFDYNKIHDYSQLLIDGQAIFKNFPWRKVSLTNWKLMLQCHFFNPLWTQKDFFLFLIDEKIGLTSFFYENKFSWLSKFQSDFFSALYDAIESGNTVPQIFIEYAFHDYSLLDLERVLPYAVKKSDLQLVRRCLRSRKKILASVVWPEDADIVSPWMAACGKSIWAVSSRLALRCQKRLVLDDVKNMYIALQPLSLPALLQVVLFESVLEPFTNCTPYFWLDQVVSKKRFYSS